MCTYLLSIDCGICSHKLPVDESDRFVNITIVKRGQITQTVSVNFVTVDGPAIGMPSSYSC